MIAAVELGHRVREVLRRSRRPLTAGEIHAILNEVIEGQDGPSDGVTIVQLELDRLRRGGLVVDRREVVALAGERAQTSIGGAPVFSLPGAC